MGQSSGWDKIEKLYFEALCLSDTQWEEFLDKNTSEPDIRARVMQLLRTSHGLSTRFMRTGDETEAATFSQRPGDLVDEWLIGGQVALGGMGEIYLAHRDRGSFQQTGALKICQSADPKVVSLFLNERRLLAALEHANISRLIDGGQLEDGRHYMVIEFVQGERITDYCERANLNLQHRLDLILVLCAALAHAHGRLILHRDIKPDNILVTDGGDIKLIDFGVAALAENGIAADAAPLTKAYAAPEQLSGDAVTVQSDIFALGKVIQDLCQASDMGIPSDLDSIIRKATAASPETRYKSVDALADDLSRYQHGQPVSAVHGGRTYRLSRFIRRHQIAVAASFLAVAALIAGLIGTTVMAGRARTEAANARAALVEAERARLAQLFEARTLEGYRYGLQSLYGGDPASGDVIDPELIDASLRNIVEDAYESALAGDLNQAYLIYAIAQNFMHRGDFEEAGAILSPIAGTDYSDPTLNIELASDLARSLYETGENDRALELARWAFTSRVGIHDSNSSGWLQDASTIAGITGEESDIDRLIDVLDDQIEDFDPEAAQLGDLSWYYNQRGSAYLRKRDYANATESFRHALDVVRSDRVRALTDVYTATNLAQFEIYFENNTAGAVDYLPQYLAAIGGELGDDPLQEGFILGLLSEAHLLQADLPEAETYAERARTVLEPYPDYRGGWYFDVSLMLARTLAWQGRQDEANALLADILPAIPGIGNGGELNALSCKYQVALIFVALDDAELRAESTDRGDEICEAALAPDSGQWMLIDTHKVQLKQAQDQFSG